MRDNDHSKQYYDLWLISWWHNNPRHQSHGTDLTVNGIRVSLGCGLSCICQQRFLNFEYSICYTSAWFDKNKMNTCGLRGLRGNFDDLMTLVILILRFSCRLLRQLTWETVYLKNSASTFQLEHKGISINALPPSFYCRRVLWGRKYQ